MGQKEICCTYSQAIYFERNDKVALPFHIDKTFQKQMRDKIKWQFQLLFNILINYTPMPFRQRTSLMQ